MIDAKPICVVKVDNKNDRLLEMFKIQEILDNRMPDYHVLVVPFEQPEEEYFEPMQIQVFHPKDFTEIQFQELKDMVIGEIKKLKQ